MWSSFLGRLIHLNSQVTPHAMVTSVRSKVRIPRSPIKSLEKVVSKNTSIQNMENYKLYLRYAHLKKKPFDFTYAEKDPLQPSGYYWVFVKKLEWLGGFLSIPVELQTAVQNEKDGWPC